MKKHLVIAEQQFRLQHAEGLIQKHPFLAYTTSNFKQAQTGNLTNDPNANRRSDWSNKLESRPQFKFVCLLSTLLATVKSQIKWVMLTQVGLSKTLRLHNVSSTSYPRSLHVCHTRASSKIIDLMHTDCLDIGLIVHTLWLSAQGASLQPRLVRKGRARTM